jgi:pSer/pThr/pTyr-binding forkhead associated (FHA) protein
MIQLELGGHRWLLAAGETIIGSAPAAAVCLEAPGVLPSHAVLRVLPDGHAAIRLASPEALVLVNGVRLGTDPVPLLHGDKIQVGSQELVAVDERIAGRTQMVDSGALAAATAQGAPAAGGAVAGPMQGGRLVSLMDGREYQVGEGPLVFGRDAACDVVIESTDVSRRHAFIQNSTEGYRLEDTSSNGVLVNGARIEGRRVLKRADLIRMGPAEFRFYAEAAPMPHLAPPGAAHRLYDTVHGMPAMVPALASPPTSPRPLATILVRTGGLRGQRLPIRAPVVNVGRAEYNDLVLAEESVSASHAKLLRKEEVWTLTDLDSTNGTFVDGDRIRGEVPLVPGSTIRFGDVTVLFDPSEGAPEAPRVGGTKVVGAVQIPDTPVRPTDRPSAHPPIRPSARPSPRPAVGSEPKPVPGWVLLLLVAVVAAVVLLLLRR